MKYFCMLTRKGEQRIAEAIALGTKISITQMAVGDGGGTLPTPDTSQTQLINERRRAGINRLFVENKNPSQLIAEQVIPEKEGGWWIREVGLFDEENSLIAVGNCPETYKPQLAEGSGRTQVIRAVFVVSHTEAVTLKIDSSVVLATREYVDIETNKKIDKQAIKQTTGDSQTNVMSQKACTDTFAKKTSQEKVTVGQIEVKSDSSWASLILTKADGNKLQLETGPGDAYFVYRDAGGHNNAFLTIPSAKNGTLALTSDVDAVNNFPVGAPIPWPHAKPPNGYIVCDGNYFDTGKYPLLNQAYPSGKVPDLRGEFIRGLDADRKVDSGRKILTEQAATSLRTAMLDYYNQDADGAWGVVGVGFKNEDSIFDIWRQDFKMPDGSNPDNHPGAFGDNGMNASVKTSIRSGCSKAINLRPRNVAFLYIVRAA